MNYAGLYGSALEDAKKDPFAQHPCGEFHGVITEVKVRDHEGNAIYEAHVKTNHGSAKVGYWATTPETIQAAVASGRVTEEVACERAVKNWTQLAKTYGAFGLAIGDTQNPAWLYENLGSWAGRRCWLVVKPGLNDPSKVNVFINGPRKDSEQDKVLKPAFGNASPGNPFGNTAPPAGGITVGASAFPDTTMDSVPF